MIQSIYCDSLDETKALTQDQINGIIHIKNFIKSQALTVPTDTLLGYRIAIQGLNLAKGSEQISIYQRIMTNGDLSSIRKYVASCRSSS